MNAKKAANQKILKSFQAAQTEDDTKQQILDAALDRFTDFGLKRTTMEDVASHAGIGRATLYRRFKDKDELFQAVIFREVSHQLQLIEAKIADFESPLEGLLEAFVQAVLQAHKHPLLVRLLTSEPERVLPFLTTELYQTMQFFRSYLSQHISKAQQQGALHERPPEQLAEMLLRLLQSLILTPEGAIQASKESNVRQFTEQCLRPLLEP